MVLNRASIDKANDLHKTLVNVPDWGGDVYVRVLTVGERLRLENDNSSTADMVVKLVSMSMCGEDGVSLYGIDGVKDLEQKSGDALLVVRDAALRINKMTKDDVEEVKKN